MKSHSDLPIKNSSKPSESSSSSRSSLPKDLDKFKKIFECLHEEHQKKKTPLDSLEEETPYTEIPLHLLFSRQYTDLETEEAPVTAPSVPFTHPILSSPAEVLPVSSLQVPHLSISPQVLELLDQMGLVMIVMTHSEIAETTITLDSAHFSESPFYNAKIVIKEFSTAPRIFNVEIIATPQAIALLQTKSIDFLAHFQKGDYPFSVNRLDTQFLEEEKPLIHRKESVSEEKEENP